MTNATYLRFELLRTFRNRRFLFFSLAFPLVIFLTVAGSNRHANLGGISLPLYLMTGMASYGSMLAVISAGSRISLERQVGWTRQLRITPLRTSRYFEAKVASGYLTAALSIACLYLAGIAYGVRLQAGEWLSMTVMILIGLLPFAAMGILLGHLLRPDSLGPAIGGLTALFAILGGAWGPIATGGVFLDIVKCLPSYWLVQAGKSALSGSGWLPAEGWIVIAIWTLVCSRLALLAYQRDTGRVS